MEEVVYQFLLQTARYPRAAIINDSTVLFPGADMDSRPTFVIVDPDTAAPLGVVHVVGAVDAGGLYAASAAADLNCKTLRPASMQGFVIRLDFKGRTDKEKIQFYQAKDKGELYPLSASTFPDLDSLKVAAKLNAPKITSLKASAHTAEAEPLRVSDDPDDDGVLEEETGASGTTTRRLGIWLGLLLIMLAIADIAVTRVLGEPLVRLTHVLLLVGAVFAFLLG